MTEEVTIAIELPVDAASLVESVVADAGKGASINIQKPEISDSAAGLTFDPVSGSAIGWFLLKVVGDTAIALTSGIIAELVRKKLQERKELARKTVRIRFPDGAVYTLVVDDPQSMARLQQIVAEKALR